MKNRQNPLDISFDDRPYSQIELKEIRTRYLKAAKISKYYVIHDKCKHFYRVKKYSKKEKEIQEKGTNLNIGNCSMCWCMRNTPHVFRDVGSEYLDKFADEAHEGKALPLYCNLLLLETDVIRGIHYNKD